MRPILLFIPSKPALVILLVIGGVLTAVGLTPKFRKSQAFSYGWFLLAAALVVAYVGGDHVQFWQTWAKTWKPVPIYAYGVMLGLSLIGGWYLALRLAEQEGIPREKTASLYMWTAVCAVISSRLLYVITNWSSFENNLIDIVKVNKGGLVAYGGFLGGFIASWVYCRVHSIPLLKWADNAMPSLSLGLAVTRIGCFLYGCDFGARTSLPWGVRFPGPNPRMAPGGSPAFEKHLHNYGLPSDATASFPVHPTQLYETTLGLVLLAVTLYVRKKRKVDGMAFLAFVWGYGIPRFLLEFLRDDEQRGGLGDWSTSQIIGIVTSILGLVLFLYLRDKAKRDEAAAQDEPTKKRRAR